MVKANMPKDAKFDFSGTTVKILDPTPGSKNPVIVTDIPTNKLSEADRINLRGESGVAAAVTRADAALTNTVTRRARFYTDQEGNMYSGNPLDRNDMNLEPNLEMHLIHQ